ncbi:MAG: sigma 54-interacting transcriptional regulator [Haliangiales bacterium]
MTRPSLTPVPAALRSILEDIDKPAILLAPNYVILASNRAYRDHYGATPRAGHDRCFAVSHGYQSPCDENGEDCPLKRGLSSRRRERVFHVHHGPSGPEHVDVELRPIRGEGGEIDAFIETISPIAEATAKPQGLFVGRSRRFSEMLGLLRRAAPSEVAILLLGESGTGKELAARAVHAASARCEGPFVPVECSGLGETLFESELFGHAKGAFTGAHTRKPGLVEAATGGTLFLDEIGDVPMSLQVKLLRLLESHSYRPVGDVAPRRADFRLVCATHRDLRAMVEGGAFRRDLYYRIDVFPVAMPPLRERREDIALLASSLLRAHGKTLSPAAQAALEGYHFPGNVRELRNLLERAVLLTDSDVIEPSALPATLTEGAAELVDRRRDDVGAAPVEAGPWPWGDAVLSLREVERRYLRWAVATHGGDREQLAAALGVSERTLYRKLAATERD